MPRPARPWFRFYVEALSDRKLRRLTPAQRWLWVAVLGAARQSPLPGYLVVSDRESMDAADLADIAGMAVKDVEKALPLFERSGLIARDPNLDCWWVPKWSGRQYESDNTTDRTRKHRSKAVPGNDQTEALERSKDDEMGVVGTPPETETETEDKPPLPPPSGGAESQHHGQHPNCRPCGTNPRATAIADEAAALRAAADAAQRDTLGRVTALHDVEPPPPDVMASTLAEARHRLAHPTAEDPA